MRFQTGGRHWLHGVRVLSVRDGCGGETETPFVFSEPKTNEYYLFICTRGSHCAYISNPSL